MSEHEGQDNGTLRGTIREAAHRLCVTEAAIRKRIQRGSLHKELGGDGRVYLDLSQDMSHSESQLHRDPLVVELVEELRDRVAFLERELEHRGMEADRYQQIVVGLTHTNNRLATRLRELEAPQVPPEDSESVVEEPGRVEVRSSTGGPQEPSTRPRDTAEFPMRGSLTRPWWRRVFGG
jgi:uncharacterized small protein (DUF1192 family)